MIKFVGDKDNPKGPIIGLGLSRDNVRLLKEGKPIVVELAPLGLSPGKVMLFMARLKRLWQELCSALSARIQLSLARRRCEHTWTPDPHSLIDWTCSLCGKQTEYIYGEKGT